jgi:hypothetical protein
MPFIYHVNPAPSNLSDFSHDPAQGIIFPGKQIPGNYPSAILAEQRNQ